MDSLFTRTILGLSFRSGHSDIESLSRCTRRLLVAEQYCQRITIRDHGTLKRRPMVRFFVCGEDVSHDAPDAPLPNAIVNGSEPFFIMGAIAGG